MLVPTRRGNRALYGRGFGLPQVEGREQNHLPQIRAQLAPLVARPQPPGFQFLVSDHDPHMQVPSLHPAGTQDYGGRLRKEL